MTDRAIGYGWRDSHEPHSYSYLGPSVLGVLDRYLRPGASVCDVGSGNGALVGAMVRHGYEAVGVEHDRTGVEIARKALPGVAFFHLGVQDDASPVLAEAGAFDAVVSTEVIEHLFSPQLLPRFATNLLRPEGILIISTPYHGYLKNLIISVLNKWDMHHGSLRDGGHIKFFSRRTLEGLLTTEGFRLLEFRGVGRAPFLWKSMIVVAQRASD